MLAFKLSSHKVQSVWQQLQSTYLSQGSMYLLCICPRFHKQLQKSKYHKWYLTCLRHCTTVQIPVKETWTQTHNKISCFVSKYSSKQFPLPTQFRSLPMTHCMSQSNAITTAVQTNILGYLMHLRNRNQRSQTGKQSSLSLRCQPTISTPSSTVPSVPWWFLSLFLSALQYLYCQANNSASGSNLKVTSQCKHPSSSTAPAHYWTSGVQLFTHYITNVATKPRSLTKQTRPSRLSCQRFSTLWQLNQGHRPSRFSCQTFSNLWQLNQGHRPSRFSCQRFSLQLSPPGMTPGSVAPRGVHSVRPGSTTTWPTCRDVILSYFSSMDLCSTLPSSPFLFQFSQMLSSDSPGTLSLFAKITKLLAQKLQITHATPELRFHLFFSRLPLLPGTLSPTSAKSITQHWVTGISTLQWPVVSTQDMLTHLTNLPLHFGFQLSEMITEHCHDVSLVRIQTNIFKQR